MNKFVIYQSTLIYAALCFKRMAKHEGLIILTEKEFSDYFNLVINDIEEEKNIAHAFSYEVIYDEEPKYNLNLVDETTIKNLNNTKFEHNKSLKLFTSTASLDMLSLKTNISYPPAINMTLRPNGYEQVLNIDNKENQNSSEPNL